MPRFTPHALGLLALLCAPLCSTGSVNLLLNPGFEDGEGAYPGVGLHWETNDARSHPEVDVLTTADKHTGECAQWLKANATWDLGMVRQVTPMVPGLITPGKTYDIRAWIKTANVYNPAGWYVFGIWWMDSADHVIGAGTKMPQQETNNYDWRCIRFTDVAPAGAVRVAALLTRHTDGDAWYDDVSIRELVPGTPVVLCTPASLARQTAKGLNPGPDTVAIQNGGTGELYYTATTDQSWLAVSPQEGASTGPAVSTTLTYDTSALAVGVHTAHVLIVDPAASNSPFSLPVSVKVLNPGDFNGDNAVDQEDFGHLQACLSGTGFQVGPECWDADLNGDQCVDGADLGLFLGCMTGPGGTADPMCTGR